MILLGHLGRVLVGLKFEFFYFFDFDDTLFEAICHFVNKAIQKLLKSLCLYEFIRLLFIKADLPKSLEYLGTLVSVLEL
jgi:hypothetical protein